MNSGPVGRAKSKLTTTGAGIEIDSLGVNYAKCDDIPVTKMIPVGDGFSQCQSPDAAPLTELRDLNTLLHIYSDCATRLNLIWTVCIMVQISIVVEEVTKCGGDLSECRTMDGAALADDRSGITFTAELCMP